MAYNGWLALGGTELINNTRTATYAAAMGLPAMSCVCPGLPYALGDPAYTTPKDDKAPWYDPAVPESEQLAGFFGLEFVGFSKGTGRRDPVRLFSEGSIAGPIRYAGREITVRAAMLASSDCAASYGIGWLAGALRGALCNAGCLGDELCLFACCPPCDATPADPGCGEKYVRRLYGVGLMEGPDTTQIRELSGGSASCSSTGSGSGRLWTVEFTLIAGRPWLFRNPVPFPAGGPVPIRGTHLRPPMPTTPNCTILGSCLVDPSCPPPVLPPIPEPPVDPCACGPTTQIGTIIEIPAGSMPEVHQKVPVITVYSGNQDLRCLTIRWYTNPLGRDCPIVVADPCNACAEVNVPFIPAYTTLTIDSRTRRATVDCPGPGGFQDATVNLKGPGGVPFEWPIFECGGAMCVEVVAAQANLATNATVLLNLLVREDAA